MNPIIQPNKENKNQEINTICDPNFYKTRAYLFFPNVELGYAYIIPLLHIVRNWLSYLYAKLLFRI